MSDVSNFKIGAGALSIDGRDVGYTTEEGAVVTYEPDVHLHLSGQFGTTPVRGSLVGQNLSVEVWIAENTFSNIEDAFAGVTRSGDTAKFGGNAGVEIVGKELVLTPFDGSASWTFKNAIPISPVETAYKVNDERILQVTFRALIDPDSDTDENIATLS